MQDWQRSHSNEYIRCLHDCHPAQTVTCSKVFLPKKIDSSCRLLDRRLTGKMLGLENDRYRWPRLTETFSWEVFVFHHCVSTLCFKTWWNVFAPGHPINLITGHLDFSLLLPTKQGRTKKLQVLEPLAPLEPLELASICSWSWGTNSYQRQAQFDAPLLKNIVVLMVRLGKRYSFERFNEINILFLTALYALLWIIGDKRFTFF